MKEKEISPFMALIKMGSSIDWEAESYPQYGDFIVIPLFVLFFPSVRFFLDRFVFEKIATRLIFGKGHYLKDAKTDKKRKKLRKFKESAWKCIYYLSAEILALSMTYNEPWFTNTRNFWVGPGDQIWPDQKMKLKLKGLYMFAAGFYVYSIFALVLWETRRSDFGVSMGHHVVSVILILQSYICRFARVGSVVLALHDASDVFLEVGKMSKYSGAEALASVSFILFALCWFLLRLTYYPFWVLWSTRLVTSCMWLGLIFNALTCQFGILLTHVLIHLRKVIKFSNSSKSKFVHVCWDTDYSMSIFAAMHFVLTFIVLNHNFASVALKL